MEWIAAYLATEESVHKGKYAHEKRPADSWARFKCSPGRASAGFSQSEPVSVERFGSTTIGTSQYAAPVDQNALKSPTQTPVSRSLFRPWLPHLLIVCLLIGTATGLLLLVEWQPLISDSLGYLVAAQRIASGYGPTYADANNQLAGSYFSLYAFQIQRPDTHLLFLGFPPGLPLLLSGMLLMDISSPLVHLVVPVMAMLTIVLASVLGWVLTKNLWTAFWVTLLLSSTQVLWQFGTSIWSEFPSAAFVTAALLLYLLAERFAFRNWGERALMLLVGALLAYSVYIRYTNIVVMPVFLVADALLIRKHPARLSLRWPLWAMAILTVISVPLFNHLYYGGWSLTSYSAAHGWYPQPAFSMSYAFNRSFIDGFSFFAGLETLWRNFTIFLPFALAGWFLLKRAGAMMCGIALILFALHSVYAFAPTGINARFIVPILPVLAIGAATAIATLLTKVSIAPRVVIASGFILIAMWQLPTAFHEGLTRNRSNAEQIRMAQAISEATPDDAVLMSYPLNDLIAVYGNRSVFNYRRVPISDPIEQRYRIQESIPVILNVVATLLEHGKPVYYVDTSNHFIADLPKHLQEQFEVETLELSGVRLYRLSLSP